MLACWWLPCPLTLCIVYMRFSNGSSFIYPVGREARTRQVKWPGWKASALAADLASALAVIFYSAAALLAMQSAVLPTAIPSVCPSVCLSVRPSVTRWYPIQMNEHRITRSSLWGSKKHSLFSDTSNGWGRRPCHLKFALKVTHPLWKAPTSTYICL